MDLLIDGTIDKPAYNQKKLAIELELTSFEEAKVKLMAPDLARQKVEMFLELMENLTGLHGLGNHAEKRQIVKDCFSNRTVVGKNLCLEPQTWLKSRKISELSPLVTQNDTLIELLRGFSGSSVDESEEVAREI